MIKPILKTLFIVFLFSSSITAKSSFNLADDLVKKDDVPELGNLALVQIDSPALMISGLLSYRQNEVRVIELYVLQDIPDLSIFSIGVANNGTGSEGQEFYLSGAATKGQFLYLALFPSSFEPFLGFAPDFDLGGSSSRSASGDSAVELFVDQAGGDPLLIDVYGNVFERGNDKPWYYRDSWVYRKTGAGPDTTFNLNDWRIPGPNVLAGVLNNSEAPVPFPTGTYGQTYDTIPPVAKCQNINFEVNLNTIRLDPDSIDNGSTDDTGITLKVLSDGIHTCRSEGLNEEILTVYDAAGNKGSCSARVNVSLVPSQIFCRDLSVNLSFDGEVEVKVTDVRESFDGACWGETAQYFLSTSNPLNSGTNDIFIGATTMDSPRDTLAGEETLFYEVFTFTVPSDGFYVPNFRFSGMEEDPLVAIISTDSIIPNTGDLEQRPGFLDAFVFEVPGTYLGSFSNEETVFLSANTTYYLQVATFNPISFIGGLMEGSGDFEEASSISFTGDDLGTNILYLVGIDDLGNTATCQSTITVKELNPFITTWKTDNPGTSDSLQITIPTHAPSSREYRYDIDWGDGTFSYDRSSPSTHTYDSAGVYTVRISGNFPRIFFNNQGDKEKLLSIEQWGDIQWTSMENAFFGCENMNITNTDIDVPDLSRVNTLAQMFDKCNAFNGDITQWDVSTIETFDEMFSFCILFDQDIGAWNMSNAKSLYLMLEETHSFNQDLNAWDVSNVTNMEGLFYYAEVFDQDLNSWDVSKVTNMTEMFYVANLFNGDISNWDVSNVETMDGMFEEAYAFNQDIGDWDVSKVHDMSAMFNSARVFNQDIGSWDVSNVTDMLGMFSGAYAFNQDISSWNVGQVRSMRNMFRNADAFNQDIGDWDVSMVTRMDAMFIETDAFNQDIGNWDVSKVEEMDAMFEGAVSFDQNLGAWDLGSLKSDGFSVGLKDMFKGAGLSVANYDATLIGWSTDNSGAEDDGVDDIPRDIEFMAGSSQYCSGVGARQHLINTYGWSISDAGQNCIVVSVDDLEFGRDISVYPNPTSEQIFFEGDLREIRGVEIYDLSGQRVMHFNNDFTSINVSLLPPSVYLLRLYSDHAYKTFKFIKE